MTLRNIALGLTIVAGLLGVWVSWTGFTTGALPLAYLIIPVLAVVGGVIARTNPGPGTALILVIAAATPWFLGVSPAAVIAVIFTVVAGLVAFYSIPTTGPVFTRFRTLFSIVYVGVVAVSINWILGYVTTEQIIYFIKMAIGWTLWVFLVAIIYFVLEKMFPKLLCSQIADPSPDEPTKM